MSSLFALLFATSGAYAVDVYMGGYGVKAGLEVAPTLTPVHLGGEASFYWNRNVRSSWMVDMGLGDRRVSIASGLVAEYVGPIGPAAFTAGGGIGYGHEWFWDGVGGRRAVHSIPMRASGGFLVRDGPREAHLRLIGEWRPPVVERLRGATAVTPALGRSTAFSLSVDVTVLFGDFTPRRKPSMFDGKPLPVDDSE